MKKTILIMMVVVLFVGGCRGVMLNSEYSEQLDKNVAISAEVVKRATAELLTKDEMVRALRASAESWRKFQNGRDGISEDPK